MTALTTASPIDQLTPISLDELVERASLQTRVDRKYLLPIVAVDMLLADVAEHVQVLQIGSLRTFAYESVYFDTPELLTYHLAAHRRRRRFKVRTRTYLDSAQCWLEVKTRGARGSTVKNRLPYDPERAADLRPGGWYVRTVLTDAGIPGTEALDLQPTLVTSYLRTTLFLPAGCSRVTIDTQLTWDDGAQIATVPHLAVIETKTGSSASPLDRVLWAHGARPVRISKYATGLATLRPELPATRWRRTLRRHVLPHLDSDRPSIHATERNGTCHA